MLSKKSLLVAGAVTTLGAASVIGLSTVSATADNKGEQSLVDKLSTRFSLNKDDVQKIFDEDRAAHEAEMEAKVEERLTQAVNDGKITEDQKTKILAKLKEQKAQIESDRDTFKDMTDDQRHEAIEKRHDELEKWATDNNIPMEYLRFKHVIKHGPGGPSGGEFHVRFHGGPGSEKSLDVQADTN